MEEDDTAVAAGSSTLEMTRRLEPASARDLGHHEVDAGLVDLAREKHRRSGLPCPEFGGMVAVMAPDDEPRAVDVEGIDAPGDLREAPAGRMDEIDERAAINAVVSE
jgi:hypothetical protein